MNLEELVSKEVDRLSKKIGRDFLTCSEIVKITGLGRDNVRALMISELPTKKVGNRQVVGILPFVLWQMQQDAK